MRESDWKLFRKHAPEWRERYLEKKNREIINTLTQDGKTPTELFWETRDMMEKESRTLVDCFDGHSRSKLYWFITLMYDRDVIDSDDLNGFSDDFRQELKRAIGDDTRGIPTA